MPDELPLDSPSALVLAGVIPGNAERLGKALGLERDMFGGDPDGFIFEALVAYYRRFRAVLPTDALRTSLARMSDAGKVGRIAQRWVALRDLEVDAERFQWAVSATVENYLEVSLARALREAGTVLSVGAVFGEDRKQGYDDAVSHLMTRLGRLARIGGGELPESDLREAYQTIMADYGSAQTLPRIPTGIGPLDDATVGGMSAGQLWFIAGFAGEGKTTFSIQLARAAMLRGYNVVYATGETLIPLVHRRLVTRHTRHPSIVERYGCTGGVDIMGVEAGTLAPEALAAYQAAAADLTANPAYGRFVTFQMPMRTTVDQIVSKCEAYESEFPIHLLVVDSIDMVRSSLSAGRRHEEVANTIEDFASMAINWDHGRGMVVLSPYQIKQESYAAAIAAEGTGRYTLNALGETIKAAQRAHLVMSLLRQPAQPDQVFAQVLKNRSGPTTDFRLELDDRSAYMGAGVNLSAAPASVTSFLS